MLGLKFVDNEVAGRWEIHLNVLPRIVDVLYEQGLKLRESGKPQTEA